jgi:HlyD family secretion protein
MDAGATRVHLEVLVARGMSMKYLLSRLGTKARIWLVVGLVVLVAIAVALSRGRGETNSNFQTSPLARGELTASVGATGTVRSAQTAVLAWQTSGTVESVAVEVGDVVRKEQLLAGLAMDSVPQTVIQAQANLVEAKRALDDAMSMTASAQAAIDLREAQDAYKKAYNYRLSLNGEQWIEEVRIRYEGGKQVPEIRWYKGLVDKQSIQKADNSLALRKAELDDSERRYERLKDGPDPDDVAAAQANVDAAQAILNTARVLSPISGTITQANPRVGDHVATGSAAFRIDDLSRLLVDVEVSEIDVNSVRVGQPALLTLDAIATTTYHGIVEQVAQAGDVSSGAVIFTVTVRMTDPSTEIKPGMTAAVNIVVKQVNGELLVPNRAVRLIDGERVVYVLRDGRPESVKIKLGESSDTMSVLAEGQVREGDLIILNPPSAAGGPGGGPVIRGGG